MPLSPEPFVAELDRVDRTALDRIAPATELRRAPAADRARR